MRVKLTDRLVETYNLEKINIGNGEELAYRIEIFKSEETIKCYSFRLLRGDFYSLVDSFNNEQISDEYLFIEDHEIVFKKLSWSSKESLLSDVVDAIEHYVSKILN